ncbi:MULTISPECIES: 1,4-dihydroxy-2-naphthoate polyprenyltransferase [unclassified Brevibacterium]|uniref:1,4-dihydroxy-2-naphthoate polyprenyltransferase n=1 Tax=unclassified Brevibacterium TaxID=2614124 RepID=UPI0008A3D22B|nr:MULTISPECIES: 1,4-dihydroxy-2-naphthoate polyprenyltransferase [unclassified Brevibacterium]OFL66413.1 1,4-dihydroxy-2-naphthoate polyprenyltransferase [Brevibacterium sp. HMSC063G07]OFS27737.1 1,4-dihydroxy-2-naphthoate polyprenyltransferase [Brevibacterium sp. HMSC07C04]
MASRTQLWISGARLRTLPLAFAPVVLGAGAALGQLGGMSALVIGSVDPSVDDNINGWALLAKGLLALVVALALQIGSNYANDYSDGIRGTDDDRVGPLRLTASGLIPPEQVKRAAFICFGIAGFAGLLLTIMSAAWWMLLVGAAAVLAAWFYTGGKRPYGYMALGEVFVFVFFGLVATLGTTYAMAGRLSPAAWAGAVAVGLYACAVLKVNNLRDIPTDIEAGKRTLAVLLGDRRSRIVYLALVFLPYPLLVVPIISGYSGALLAVGSIILVMKPVRAVVHQKTGHALVPAIKHTSIAALVYAVLLSLGLAL